jgi:hypothetical protein
MIECISWFTGSCSPSLADCVAMLILLILPNKQYDAATASTW